MKKYSWYLIFVTPLILLLEVLFINEILSYLSQLTDVAVFAGVGLICLDLFLNFLLIKFIIKLFSKTTKNN